MGFELQTSSNGTTIFETVMKNLIWKINLSYKSQV